MVKKAIQFNDCTLCKSTLIGLKDISSLTAMRDYFGKLTYPSKAVITLIKIIEECIMSEVSNNHDCFGKRGLTPETFSNIMKLLQNLLNIPRVGCENHFGKVMEYIINFYVIFRLNILCDEARKSLINNQKNRRLRKSGKLN